MADDLPSGKRMFELAQKAIDIEKSAEAGCSLCYELFVTDLCNEADYELRKMDPTEKRFFEMLLRENYVKPHDRGEDWQSSYEIRSELRRELEGEEEYEIDEPGGLLRGEDFGIYQDEGVADNQRDEQSFALDSGSPYFVDPVQKSISCQAHIPEVVTLVEQLQKASDRAKGRPAEMERGLELTDGTYNLGMER